MKIKIWKNTAAFFLLFSFAACQNGGLDSAAVEKRTSTQKAEPVRVSRPDADAAEPAMAADAQDGLYVVWVEHGAKKEADVYLRRFDAGGSPSSEPVRVNSETVRATAWRGDPPVVRVGADGAIYVGWTALVKTEQRAGTDLYVSVSRDGGRSFTQAKVNDDAAPASHGMHSLAVDSKGKIIAAWLDERNIKSSSHALNEAAVTETTAGYHFDKVLQTQTPAITEAEIEPNSEVYYAVSNDGGKTFAPNRKLAGDVCPCCKTSLAVAPDDKIYLSWRQVLPGDFRHIAVAASADGGDNFGPATIVSDDRWQLNACPVSGAALSAGPGETLKIIWYTSGEAGKPGLYAAESRDGGQSFTARTLISEDAAPGLPILLAGHSKVVWESKEKLYLKNSADPAVELGAGMLPSAVSAGGKIYVAFLKRENDKRGVWLAAAE